MSTNRPFLSNFFAAFRAHSVIQKAATNSPSATAGSTTPSSYTHNTNIQQTSSGTSPNASSAPRTITTKANHSGTGPTTAAVQATAQFQPTRQHTASPYSRSPGSPGSPGFPMSPSHKQRRGSDSSSDGFREVTDKWYIGGRTATGEERFYRLGMVKRQKSIDRLSLDRLSI